MKNKAGFFLFILMLTAFILFVSCGKQKSEWKGAIEEADGITVVRNPVEPLFGDEVLELEEELVLGEKEGREEYMFTRIMIDVDDDENIYVLDGAAANIRVFDKEGEYTRTIGKRGQGPGEFEGPRCIQITPQNEIMVYDMRNRRISYFSLDGTFLRQNSAATELAMLNLQQDSEGNYVGYVVKREGGFELTKFDSELRPLNIIFSKQVARIKTFPLLSLQLLFSLTKEDRLAWGYPEKYEFQVVGPEAETMVKILKDYKPIEIMNDDKESMMSERFGSRGVPDGFAVHCPENYPPFRGLFVDEEGRMFLETYEKCEGGGRYSDVFNSEGKYIAKVRLGIDPVWLWWKKSKLYTIEKDEEGYMFVKRYRATWKI